MNLKKLLVMICSLGLLFGCSVEQEVIEREEDLLLLGNKLPFDIGYQDVKSYFPKLGPLRDEGRGMVYF